MISKHLGLLHSLQFFLNAFWFEDNLDERFWSTSNVDYCIEIIFQTFGVSATCFFNAII